MVTILFCPTWRQDFPKDPSGSFDQFKGFIRSSFELCKWIGLSIVSVQVSLSQSPSSSISFSLHLIDKGIGLGCDNELI